MLKYTETVNYATGEKKEFIVGVNATMYGQYETVQVMSDVWEQMYIVYYWDEQSETIRSRAQCDYNRIEYTFDADLDVILPKIEEKNFLNQQQIARSKVDAEANIVAVKGREVKVVRGKTAQGTVGKVVAMTQKYYGNHYNAPLRYKVAIALDDEMTTFTAKNGKQYPCHKNVVWVWDLNCEVVNLNVDYTDADRRARDVTDGIMKTLKASCEKCIGGMKV